MGTRILTDGEWAALSPGLRQALERAGVTPRVRDQASPLALVAALWRGGAPIMVLGSTIWWPKAPDDLSTQGRRMAVLQHELQHVLEFATGKLSLIGYALLPFNWTYAYQLDAMTRWDRLGAEQRAQMAQDYWLAERGLAPHAQALAALIPWAA